MENREKRNSDMIDVAGLLQEYLSKWYYFAISIVICCVFCFCYTKIKKENYQINANVLISQEEGGGVGNFGGLAGLFGGSGYVDDEVFVVSSHSVMKDVTRDLGLYRNHILNDGILTKTFMYDDYPIDVMPVYGEIADTLRTPITFNIEVDSDGHIEIEAKAKKKTIAEVEADVFPVIMDLPYGQFKVDKTNYYVPGKDVDTKVVFMGYDGAAEMYSQDITIDIASKKSNVIAMNLVTPNIEFGKDLLNEIIKKYNERGVLEKNMQAQKTSDFIDSRLLLLSDTLALTESVIEKYKRDQGIIDVSTEAQYQLSKKGQIESRLINAETQCEILEMTKEYLNNEDNKFSLIPTAVESGSLQAAISSYNNLIMSYIRLSNGAKENNASLKALITQIEAMRANVQATLDKVYENALVSLNELRSQVNLAEQRLSNIPTQEREYINIVREKSIKEQLYLFLLQRREETAMMMANAVPKGIVVDNAYALSEPVGMSKKVLYLLALIFGMVIPPIILYIRKLLRFKFETREEVERLTSVPVIGEVCVDNSGDALIIKNGGSTSAAELFRLIRSNLQFIMNGTDDKVVLMTSTVSGEGKSFISINLASSLAMLGKRVLLVGMDIRSPKLKEYLSLKVNHGLTEYLSSDMVSLDDIIIKEPKQKNMDIIVAGPVPPNPSELLASTEVDELFAELRGMYDYIIVDSAPVGMVSDTFALGRIADATVYVCRANYTSIRDMEFVNRIYEDGRLKKMALVVNGTTAKKGYGYGYGQSNHN